MITLQDFGAQRPLVEQSLAAFDRRSTQRLGAAVRLQLVDRLDDALLTRMLELEDEVFRIEDNVYNAVDIRECLAEEDSLLLVLSIDDRVEGYLFGYDDDPDDPEVADTDYFIDSAVVSLAWQAQGIGSQTGALTLYLLALLGYRRVGLTTEPRDKTGRDLLGFYRKLGFVEAPTKRADNLGMRIELDAASVQRLEAALLGDSFDL